MPTNCTGGQISTLQVNNTDCECVSISQISVNPAGTQVTITLTNGQSLTFTIPTGPAGETITPEFRVSGTYLQYSIDEGANWINLYDFTELQSGLVLENSISNSATAGTTWETLKTYTIPAGKLSSDKDYVHIRARFKSSGTIQAQECRLQFNGSTLASGNFSATTSLLMFDIVLSRITQTTAKYDGQVQVAQPFFAVSVVTSSFIFPITSIAGLDWDANSYTITAQGDSVVIGDVVCEELQITYYNKS